MGEIKEKKMPVLMPKIIPKNKKGDIQIVFIIMILLFMGALGSVIFHYTFNKMAPLLGEKLEETTVGKVNLTGSSGVIGKAQSASDILDYVFIFVFGGGLFAIIITSFLVRTHPIFFVAYIIIAAIAILVAVPLSNAYQQFEETNVLNETFEKFNMTSHTMRNLPLYILITVIISVVIIYAKRQPEEYMV